MDRPAFSRCIVRQAIGVPPESMRSSVRTSPVGVCWTLDCEVLRRWLPINITIRPMTNATIPAHSRMTPAVLMLNPSVVTVTA